VIGVYPEDWLWYTLRTRSTCDEAGTFVTPPERKATMSMVEQRFGVENVKKSV
jgi:hypothetical protein